MAETKKEIHIVFQVLNFLHDSFSKQYKLLPIDKLILITLASHKGSRGIFPMQETLADELGIKRRHLRYRLQYLESIGLIWIEKIARKHYYHLQKLSTIEAPQCTYPEIIEAPQCTSQGHYSAAHRGTVVAPNNKVSNKLKKRESARKSLAPLSPDFSPDQKTRGVVKELSIKKECLDDIFGGFMEYFLDSGEARKDWQFECRKWFKREVEMRGNEICFVEAVQKVNISIEPKSKERPMEEKDQIAAKEALAIIMSKLPKLNGYGGQQNGILGYGRETKKSNGRG